VNSETEKILGQVVQACEPEIEKAAAVLPGFGKIVAPNGTFDPQSGTYTAQGWALSHQEGMVFWRPNCGYNVAATPEHKFVSASPNGCCEHGTMYTIIYKA
jgi:hypothetical protein